MASVAERLITAEEFASWPDAADGSRHELIRGVVVTMPPPGFLHGVVQIRVGGMVDAHVRPRKLGRVTVESGMLTERDPDTVRGPDVAFWSVERLPLEQTPRGYPDVAADLCIEILSPGKGLRAALDKIHEYFERGVRLVWIVDPEARTVAIYRSPDEGRIVHGNAILTGEDVLPDFRCRVSEIFE